MIVSCMLLLLLISSVTSSPHMCHCGNGQYGLTCPQPIQLNCPPSPPCPQAPPCNPFPTLPPLSPSNSLQGLAQFTLPTLAPFGQSSFSQQATPLPLPVAPPSNGQESLLPINNNQQQQQQQQQYAPPPPQQFQAQPQQVFPQPAYQPPQVNVNPAQPVFETTQKPTTIPGELYVEAESPEYVAPLRSGDVYENDANNGFRRPVVKRDSNGDSNVLTDKCNDERLKKIIEENVDNNPSTSKRKIQKAATEEIGGLFDVICSAHDFSYLANTQLFCEAGNDDVTCFAFLHSLIH